MAEATTKRVDPCLYTTWKTWACNAEVVSVRPNVLSAKLFNALQWKLVMGSTLNFYMYRSGMIPAL